LKLLDSKKYFRNKSCFICSFSIYRCELGCCDRIHLGGHSFRPGVPLGLLDPVRYPLGLAVTKGLLHLLHLCLLLPWLLLGITKVSKKKV
jgi:hypothetical protein